jgi:hypothetical protein
MIPHVNKTHFLYGSPFTCPASQTTQFEYLLDYLDDKNREDEIKIRDIIRLFAVEQGLLDLINGEVRINPERNVGSWKWRVCTTNFRSLVSRREYSNIIQSLLSGETYAIDQIIDLHMRLGTLFPHSLLNTIVNQTYASVALIPYDLGSDEEISWKEIHMETPFVWILIYIQVLLRTQTTKTIAE